MKNLGKKLSKKELKTIHGQGAPDCNQYSEPCYNPITHTWSCVAIGTCDF